MAAGFRTRRIKTETSIGDKLKRARTRKKISVSEVEEQTKIRAKFILALESDSWEQIPSEVYGRGYLETYAQFLQLPVDAVMKQYGRERELYARHCPAGTELAPKARLSMPRFLLTPRFFAILFVAFIVLGGGSLAGYQIKKFSSAPYLELAGPAEAKAEGGDAIIVSATSVHIQGKTAIGASVTVNGNPVPVEENGAFEDNVEVQKGTNAILVEAVNTKGKTTSEILSVTAR